MSWLSAHLYDWFTRGSEEACLSAWRAELLSKVGGSVLEVGAGTGANLRYYPSKVTRLVLSEPDFHMRQVLRKRPAPNGLGPIELFDCAAEDLFFPDSSFDFVVSTLVLCSVRSLERSIAEIRRVLKPGGALVFLEHVAAEDRPARLRWQQRLEPFWRRLMGNCHLTRRTATAIANEGFEIETLARESIRKASPIVRPSVRGVARKLP